MMSGTETPTAVVLYAVTRGGPVAAARFRWSGEGGVALEVLDERWGDFARRLGQDGVSLRDPDRVVRPDAGPAFMRALLEPSRATYYYFADESSGATS